jgi:hypothetical protein
VVYYPHMADTAETTTTTDPPRRINVAITPSMLAALDLVIEREGVTLTEAVRRLIGYGDFVYRTAQMQGDTILVQRGETTKEIVLL